MVFDGVGSQHQVEPRPVDSDTATVVFIQRRDRDSYGEGFEGDGSSGYFIFQVGNRFFKKSFHESSFNEMDLDFWDDPIEVFGEVKTEITFIPKER